MLIKRFCIKWYFSCLVEIWRMKVIYVYKTMGGEIFTYISFTDLFTYWDFDMKGSANP
jgi:hypothetical protein